MSDRLVHHLRDIFARNADRTLAIDARNNDSLTYGEFLHNSLVMASALRDRGVKPGDQVAFSIDNCFELATLYFACMHLRATILPINPASHARDFGRILDASEPRMLFVSPVVREKIADVVSQFADLEVLCFKPQVERAKKRHEALINFDFTGELSSGTPLDEAFAGAEDEDRFLTMMTSGTTSTPKGIDLCYRGLVGNGLAFAKVLGLNRDHRFYNILPMTYLGGFYNLMLIPILVEGSFIVDGATSVSNVYAFWEVVREFKVTALWYTATTLSMLLSLEDETDLSFLREQISIALCGMAPLSVDLKKRFEARFGFTLYENYALSETTFLTTNHPGLTYKDGSVGTPLDGVTIKILDPDMQPLPPNMEGQVLVTTPYFMAGYRQCEESDRAQILPSGGFLTGDIGYFDDDGELFISGRVKDIIIRGGINISPKTIEDVLYGLEAIEEASVVGIPHSVYGEEVAAVVKVRDSHRDTITVEDVKQYCQQNLANFQRPKFVYLIDELPKGVTGKIQKVVLQRLIREKADPLGA